MMYILNVLAPVFAVIALGVVLRRIGFVGDDVLAGMNRLAYWVGLPCLLLHKIAAASFVEAASFDVLWLVLIGMGASLAVGGAVARALRVRRAQAGAFLQAVFRGNLAFVGLAVVLSAFAALPGAEADVQARAERAVVLTLGPIVPVYNIVAVLVLLGCNHSLGARTLRTMGLQVATNPLLVASAAGVAVSLSGWSFPPAVQRTLQTVGQLALPLALLCIGGRIASARLGERGGLAVLAAVIKVTVGPAVGYVAARWMGIGPVETAAALILLACPTAVASYVLSEQLGADSALSAGAVVVSTILSVVSLAVVVAMI